MKKLTYGLDRHTITLRRVTFDGELNSGNKEQYSVSVKKDLTPALSTLECALIQVNYSATRNAAESDENRGLIVKRVGVSSNNNSIYIPTLCIIGSMMHLSSKHKIFDLMDISEAVARKNELWEQAVKDFNGLFSQEDIRCLKKAVRHPQGRRILNRFLAGLRFVTDLFYESYALKRDGLFEESYEIDEIISNIGIMQMDAYMLLLSPMHPEQQTLVEFIDGHSSCHELYLSDYGRWVMVNKRVIKNVNVDLLEQYMQALDDGGVNKNKVNQVPVMPVLHNTDVSDVREPDVNVKEEPTLDTPEPSSIGFDSTTKEPDSNIEDLMEQGDFGDGIEEPEQEEPEQEEPEQEEPEQDELEQDEPEKDEPDQENATEHRYSAKRHRPEIRRPNPVKAQSDRSLFSKPSNAASVNFDVNDI